MAGHEGHLAPDAPAVAVCRLVGAVLLASVLVPAAGRAQEPATIPPPVPQRSAECDHPTYATDMLVCDDGELAALDRDVATLTARAERAGLTEGLLLEEPEAWFRRRSLCAFSAVHRACAAAAYRERAAVLETLLASRLAAPALRLRCSGATWDATFVPAQGNRPAALALSTRDRAAQPVGIALDAGATDDWRPYLRFERTGEQVTLMPIDGDPRACTIGPR